MDPQDIQLPHVGEKETYNFECYCVACVKVHIAIRARVAEEKALLAVFALSHVCYNTFQEMKFFKF